MQSEREQTLRAVCTLQGVPMPLLVLLGALCTLQGVPTPLLVLLGAVCTLQGVPMPLLCATRSSVTF